jgi:hypothetical protein
MFYLVRLDPDGEKPLPEFGPYEAGPDAAREAKALTERLGVKVQPRRMRQAPNWKERQARRLESGELTPLPAGWDLPPIPDHFAHISKRSPSLIAFTADDAQGILDRVTTIRPGAYLMRFYPDLSDPLDLGVLRERLGGEEPTEEHIAAERRRLGENARKRYAGLIDKGIDINFATTPDEIEWVYENGTESESKGSMVSCMTTAYQKGQGRPGFVATIHPVRVYGAGDLAVAYTTGKSGNVAERCVVWPEKLVHSGVYSDGSGRLKKLLDAAGYKPAGQRDFDGARLLRIVQDLRGEPHFVLPHIDLNHSSPYSAQAVRDDGEFIVIDNVNGPMRASAVSGLVKAVLYSPMLRAA